MGIKHVPRTLLPVLFVVLFVMQPTVAFGRDGSTGFDDVSEYNEWLASRSSSYRRSVNKLDDDPVKKFAIPVLFGVALSDLTPNFGDPRDGGARTHEGEDILAHKGVPIVTPTEAVVMRTGSGASSGKYVYTANPGGETFVYMHLDTIADIKSGQLLKVGDTIGTVGDTGNAKGTYHLHFEVRKGKALDPFPRLTKEFTLEDKMGYLKRALSDVDDSDELIDLMVEEFSGVLYLAEAQGIELDTNIAKALKNGKAAPTLADADVGLSLGDDSRDVKALQTALITANAGPAAAKLAAAGATGYFGPVTKAALLEYQKVQGLSAGGTLTKSTKDSLLATTKTVTKPLAGTSKTGAPNAENAALALALLTELQKILKQVPTVATGDLGLDATGANVSLVQTYLIVNATGDAVTKLSTAGATGTFGPVTAAALKEYQTAKSIPATGVYDAATRAAMIL